MGHYRTSPSKRLFIGLGGGNRGEDGWIDLGICLRSN